MMRARSVAAHAAFGLAFLLLSPLSPPAASAADKYPVGPEGEVVTPTRKPSDPFKAPYTVERIGPDSLVTPKGVPDVFKSVAGASVQKTSPGQGSPYLRGLTGYHTLFLIDGIRLNNATFRAGNNQYANTIDPLSIGRIEVVKGSSSVLYGSDAIGGTVNALTIDPWGGEGFHSRTYSKLASAERSTASRQEFAGSFGALSFVGGASYKDFGDVSAGRHTGLAPNTGYWERDADCKVKYALDGHTVLTIVGQTVTQNDAPRTHTTTASKSFRGTAVGTDIQRELDQRRDLAYVKLAQTGGTGPLDAWDLTLSYQNQAERQDRIRSNLRTEVRAYSDMVLGTSFQAEKSTSIGDWTAGWEYYQDDVDSSGIDYNFDKTSSIRQHYIQGQVGDEAEYQQYGFYLQDEIHPEGAGWAVIPGLRFTRVDADAQEVDVQGVSKRLKDDWDNLSASLRGRLDLLEEINFFGGASQGFRAPNLSDLSRLDVARSGELEVASPDLDPEKFLQYEAGVKHRSKQWEGQAAYYYTQVHDFIDRVPTGVVVSGSREVTKKNTGNGYLQGVETSGTARLDEEWSLSGAAGWQIGAVDTYETSDISSKKRRPMSNMAPASGTVGARWTQADKKRLWIEGLATFTRQQHRLSPGDKLNTERIPPDGTPGWSVFTLRAGKRLSGNWTVTAAVENLTDADYRAHGSGTNEPGTNFILAVEARY